MSRNTRFTAQIALPAWPIADVKRLTNTDDMTWLVGGTVRDLLVNRPLHDWDFVTTMDGIKLAKKVANQLKGAFYVLDQSRETGRAVVTPPNATCPLTLDFATLRAKSLTDDLRLRDFTINAMAMSLTGQLLDPLDCQDDLEKSMIRMTTPDSFIRDPVRLLRAIRQSQTLDFPIEKLTYATLYEQANLIGKISPERINAEMCSILRHHTTAGAVGELEKTSLLHYILPELDYGNENDSWTQTLQILAMIDQLMQDFENTLPDYAKTMHVYINSPINVDINQGTLIKWAALLHTIPIEKIRERLTESRMPNKSIHFVCTLLESYQATELQKPDISRRQIFRFFKQAQTTAPGAVLLSRAFTACEQTEMRDSRTHLTFTKTARKLIEAYFSYATEFISPVPFLRGGDLLALGVPPGRQVGLVINLLLEAQVAGEVKSRESAIEYVKRQLSLTSYSHE